MTSLRFFFIIFYFLSNAKPLNMHLFFSKKTTFAQWAVLKHCVFAWACHLHSIFKTFCPFFNFCLFNVFFNIWLFSSSCLCHSALNLNFQSIKFLLYHRILAFNFTMRNCLLLWLSNDSNNQSDKALMTVVRFLTICSMRHFAAPAAVVLTGTNNCQLTGLTWKS